ncbi:hypothetical protein [Devosia sp. 2618]|uniref:hypothetical protein n=1 Tax=Devosia sp. 2618 TaxID=3156454 RepID=UPI00339A8270
MADYETNRPGLPMALDPQSPRPSLKRSETTAAFVSQLLAERNRVPAQRARQRATPQGAVGAYAAGGQIAVRRMPVGYRTSVVV